MNYMHSKTVMRVKEESARFSQKALILQEVYKEGARKKCFLNFILHLKMDG